MMRTITLIMLLLASIGTQGQGIEFFHGSWAEAKDKAETEDKIIFVDAYASWCGPCKRMAKNVFADPDVGAFINASFVPLKLDMEKAESKDFGKEYSVSAYPTLFFLNEKGELLKRIVGGRDIAGFMALAEQVLESYDRSGSYAELYDKGGRDYDLVYNYVKALNNANKSSSKIANDYLRSDYDFSSEERAMFLFESLTRSDSRLFEMFVKERKTIEHLLGQDAVAQKIEDACWNTIQTAIDFETQSLVDEAKSNMKNHLAPKAKNFGYQADYEYAKAVADAESIGDTAIKVAKHTADKDAEKLHDLCNELLQYKALNPNILTSSEDIAKMAVNASDAVQYKFTYAKILLANNKNKKALKEAKKALNNSEDPHISREIEEWISVNK